MKSLGTCARGQSLVESALLLPVLLCLLAGGYWAFRHFALSGSAESASQAHLLRSGRRQSSIESALSRTIRPGGGVRIRSAERPLGRGVLSFPGMSGTTLGSAEVSCGLDPVGAYQPLPGHNVHREAEAAVDCWGKDSRSGSTIRRTVQATVLTGWLR